MKLWMYGVVAVGTLALATACTGKTTKDTSGGDTSGTSGTTASVTCDSGTLDSGVCVHNQDVFTPYAFFVGGDGAYDAANDDIRSFIINGTEYNPDATVQVASKDYFNGYDSQYLCVYLLSANDSTLTQTTQQFTDTEGDGKTTDTLTHMYWYMSPGAFTVTGSANNKSWCDSWDPSFTTDSPDTVIGNWGWGIGFGGMRGDVAKYKSQFCSDGTNAIPCVGGGTYWSLFGDSGMDPAYTSDGVAFGGAVDDSFNLLLDGSSEKWLAETDMDPSVGASSGLYSKYPLFGFDATYLLP